MYTYCHFLPLLWTANIKASRNQWLSIVDKKRGMDISTETTSFVNTSAHLNSEEQSIGNRIKAVIVKGCSHVPFPSKSGSS